VIRSIGSAAELEREEAKVKNYIIQKVIFLLRKETKLKEM
jgi:hypothetical protein